MKHAVIAAATAALMLASSPAMALDSASLVGKWQLVESAKDSNGNICPFVGKRIEFTADGRMISANMPMPFLYKVNPTEAEVASAVSRNPELKGMEIMLAKMGNSKREWINSPIVYGVRLKGDQFEMKVSGYTPARYKREKK